MAPPWDPDHAAVSSSVSCRGVAGRGVFPCCDGGVPHRARVLCVLNERSKGRILHAGVGRCGLGSSLPLTGAPALGLRLSFGFLVL